MWSKIHRNYLPILSGLIFLFIVGVVVVEIDRQIYQDKKKEICINNIRTICPDELTEKLYKETERYFTFAEELRKRPEEQSQVRPMMAEALREMDKETSRILQGGNCLVSISVYSVRYVEGKAVRADKILAREVDKYRQQNTFANSLLLRRFWGEGRHFLQLSPEQNNGEIVFRYTSPRNIPEINELTRQYRAYVAGVVLVLALLYWYILRHLILPIKIVTSCIDQSKGTLPTILPRPRTVLEAAYNDLARDALLNAVTRSMAEYMSVDRLVSRDEIVGGLPEVIAPHFGFAAVYAVELDLGGGPDPTVRWSCAAFHDRNHERLPKPAEGDWMALGRQFGLGGSSRVLDFRVGDPNKGRPYFAMAIAADQEERRAAFLAATPLGSLSQENLRWSRDTLLRLANAVRSGLETLDLQRDLIAREKSKANISLSRALGHDLTNVIATSKLELDTVRRILHLPPESRTRLDPPLQDLFSESLQGLLNNTKFLQEIINIYRSFSYVHHPEYERVDVSALASEVADLFRLSLSRRVQIRKKAEGDVPRSYVEPRLLKLAIFNLLTNAMDALKRRAMRENNFVLSLGIETSHDRAANTITISVRDNGEGIRNQRGELASPDEIRTIFHGGFTTKREGIVEGLGLNWVRQIVHDFHRGQLRARNLPDGGAEVSLVLPYREAASDRNGQGNEKSTVGREEPPPAKGSDDK